MTDNDIKKALECCGNQIACTDGCPLDDLGGIDKCVHTLLLNALDLINRQQAEIEKLNVELVGMRGACESYKMHYDNAQAEIERLKKVTDLPREGFFTLLCDALVYTKTIEEYNKFRKAIKSEAIKEFAERLKEEAEECGRIDFNGCTYCAVGFHHIDNLVKEMVGE